MRSKAQADGLHQRDRRTYAIWCGLSVLATIGLGIAVSQEWREVSLQATPLKEVLNPPNEIVHYSFAKNTAYTRPENSKFRSVITELSIEDGQALATLTLPPGEHLTISQDGSYLVLYESPDSVLAAYAIDTGKNLWRYSTDSVGHVHLSPNGKLVVVVGRESAVCLKASSGEHICAIPVPRAVSNKWLITTDKNILIYSLENGELHRSVQWHSPKGRRSHLMGVSISSDDETAALLWAVYDEVGHSQYYLQTVETASGIRSTEKPVAKSTGLRFIDNDRHILTNSWGIYRRHDLSVALPDSTRDKSRVAFSQTARWWYSNEPDRVVIRNSSGEVASISNWGKTLTPTIILLALLAVSSVSTALAFIAYLSPKVSIAARTTGERNHRVVGLSALFLLAFLAIDFAMEWSITRGDGGLLQNLVVMFVGVVAELWLILTTIGLWETFELRRLGVDDTRSNSRVERSSDKRELPILLTVACVWVPLTITLSIIAGYENYGYPTSSGMENPLPYWWWPTIIRVALFVVWFGFVFFWRGVFARWIIGDLEFEAYLKERQAQQNKWDRLAREREAKEKKEEIERELSKPISQAYFKLRTRFEHSEFITRAELDDLLSERFGDLDSVDEVEATYEQLADKLERHALEAELAREWERHKEKFPDSFSDSQLSDLVASCLPIDKLRTIADELIAGWKEVEQEVEQDDKVEESHDEEQEEQKEVADTFGQTRNDARNFFEKEVREFAERIGDFSEDEIQQQIEKKLRHWEESNNVQHETLEEDR